MSARAVPPFVQTYRMLQYPFRVESDDSRLGELIESFLGWFRSPESGRVPTYRLRRARRNGTMLGYVSGYRFHRGTSVAGLLSRFLWQVNSTAIRKTDNVVLVHSAAASWKGEGVLMPASMESGKTTLVAGLVQAGFGYLTDEAAVIDPATSWVHPYPRPLSMDPGSVEALGPLARKLPPEYGWGTTIQYQIRPSHLRGRPFGKPCPVRYVVAPKYDPKGATRLDPISRATALTELVQNSFNLERFGSRGVRILGGAVENAECYRLRVADLGEAVQVMMRLVADGSVSNGRRGSARVTR
jgi:hypothetical protein